MVLFCFVKSWKKASIYCKYEYWKDTSMGIDILGNRYLFCIGICACNDAHLSFIKGNCEISMKKRRPITKQKQQQQEQQQQKTKRKKRKQKEYTMGYKLYQF